MAGYHFEHVQVDPATGVMVPPGDSEGMALGIERLLNDGPSAFA
jgi:hypothetical protein